MPTRVYLNQQGCFPESLLWIERRLFAARRHEAVVVSRSAALNLPMKTNAPNGATMMSPADSRKRIE